MKAVILAITARLKTVAASEPVPSWSEYLRSQGGFRG